MSLDCTDGFVVLYCACILCDDIAVVGIPNIAHLNQFLPECVHICIGWGGSELNGS